MESSGSSEGFWQRYPRLRRRRSKETYSCFATEISLMWGAIVGISSQNCIRYRGNMCRSTFRPMAMPKYAASSSERCQLCCGCMAERCFFKACFSWQSVLGLFEEIRRILSLARFYEVIYKLNLRGWGNVSFFVTLKSRVEVIVTCRGLLNWWTRLVELEHIKFFI